MSTLVTLQNACPEVDGKLITPQDEYYHFRLYEVLAFLYFSLSFPPIDFDPSLILEVIEAVKKETATFQSKNSNHPDYFQDCRIVKIDYFDKNNQPRTYFVQEYDFKKIPNHIPKAKTV